LDGRVRPWDAHGRRVAVARLLAQDPEASLRQIAVRADVSPETVRMVKATLRSGDGSAIESRGTDVREEAGARPAARGAGPDARRWLRTLTADPAVRSTETGRLLLRLLGAFPVLEREAGRLVEAVPDHDLDYCHRLALAHAEAWRDLAARAALRIRQAAGAES
jgi:hypothetical protein